MTGHRLLFVILVRAFTIGVFAARPGQSVPCETDGVSVRYAVSYRTTRPTGYRVDAVVVSDIAAACLGQSLVVALTRDGLTIATGGPVSASGSQMAVALAPPRLAEEVNGVHVEIGSDPPPALPGPLPSPGPSPDPVAMGPPYAGPTKGSSEPDPRAVFGWIVVGTDEPDDLGGDVANDLICGLLSAGEGDDVVRVGPRRDQVRGWAARDHIGQGRGDAIDGGAGFDVCHVDEADTVSPCESVVPS